MNREEEKYIPDLSKPPLETLKNLMSASGVTAEQSAILQEFAAKLEANMRDLPPEFSKLVDEHFWEMM